MLEVAAVLFTITIPTAVEEQRLKKACARNLSEDGTTTTVTNSTLKTTTTITSARSTLSSSGDELSLSRSPPRCGDTLGATAQLATPSPRKQLTDVQELHQMPHDTAMEHVLQQILRKFQIDNAMWVPNREGNTYQITFTLAFNEVYENLYEALQQWGIGDREGSTVSVTNCIASKSYVNRRGQSDKQPVGDTTNE